MPYYLIKLLKSESEKLLARRTTNYVDILRDGIITSMTAESLQNLDN